MNQASDTEKLPHLLGGHRPWWDIGEDRIVMSATGYIPFGCPDWGETKRQRNSLCQFCGLPNSVKIYRDGFYAGEEIPDGDHVRIFRKTLQAMDLQGAFHTLMIFNAGSFTAMPAHVQHSVLHEVAAYESISRIVIESRAPLITAETLTPLAKIVHGMGKQLTVRIGVETKNDHLRLKVLRKGHSRIQLARATALMRELGVTSGGYALLNPAPGLDPVFAVQEAIQTLEWILDQGELGMDEAYLGPTCVSPQTSLAAHWNTGDFAPPSLWAVYDVLVASLDKYPGRIHLLRFKDEPSFIAVPSNHVPRGIPESLKGAEGCDLEFHAMFDRFRDTMDRSVLYKVSCPCRS